MNPSPDIPDPWLKSLTDEAADLPGLAASEARRFRARRLHHRRQWALVFGIVIIGAGFWQSFRLVHPVRKQAGSPPILVQQMPASKEAHPAEFVKVQTMEEAMSEPFPIPPGASQQQKELLEAARGLPLLLVMDDSGKLARIHVIER